MQHEPSAKRPRPGEELVGTVIRGKWVVDQVLGSGGMATVVAATHRINGRRVALKVLHRAFAGDPAARERFLRESYLGNKVPHRGRVEVFDDDVTDDGVPFLIMDFLDGETIAQLQRRLGKRLPLDMSLDFAEQLLDVLASCHREGILHLDLKPANVLVTPQGDVKLLDFGVAQLRDAEDEEGRTGMALGTPSFMSPEQARGLADQLDGRSDLFSVGAMLFFMLSGTRLYKGMTTDEALDSAASRPPPSIRTVAFDLSPLVVAVVDRALAFEPDDRYQSAVEMRDTILDLLRVVRASSARGRTSIPPGAPSAPPSRTPIPGLAPSPSVRTPIPPRPSTPAIRTPIPAAPSAPPVIRTPAPPPASRPLMGSSPSLVSVPTVAPSFSGDLSRSPVPHLSINILQRTLTGSLQLTEVSGRTHWLCFEDGVPTKLDSSATRDGAPLVLRVAALGGLASNTTYSFFVGHDALPSAMSLPAEPLATAFRAIVAWKDVNRKTESLKRLGNHPLALHPAATITRFGFSARERAMLTFTLEQRLSYPEAELAADDRDTLRDILYTLALLRHLDLGPSYFPFGVVPPPPSSKQVLTVPTSSRPPSQTGEEDRLSLSPDWSPTGRSRTTR